MVMKSMKPQKSGKYHQGYYKLRNPQKYLGNPETVIYRSGLESRFFKFLDLEPSVVLFACEETHVPYVSPIDNKIHRYFVDIIFQMSNGERIMAEIKPFSQCQEPKKPKNGNRKALVRYMNEMKTWEINKAKWEAAQKFCKSRGMTFMILTEKNLPRSLR